MSRKHVHRDRRRTDRALDDAFAALERGELVLAMRIGRRAHEAGSMNVRIGFDFARLAAACGEPKEAENALRSILAAVPGLAEARELLAELLWQAGRRKVAVAELAKVVAGGADVRTRERLEAWRAEVGAEDGAAAVAVADAAPELPERWRRFDVPAGAAEFVDHGAILLRGLCTADECRALRADWEAGADPFDREDRMGEGDAHGRFFLHLPGWVGELRDGGYGFAARLGNELRRLLLAGRTGGGGAGGTGAEPPSGPWPSTPLPGTLAAWRTKEPRFASPRPFVRVLRVGAGGMVPGPAVVERGAFPLRLLVDVGEAVVPAAERLLVLADHRPGKKVRERGFAMQPGDGVLFAARDRFDRVGGVLGLQAVRWRVVGGERRVLDVPFDDG